jgi:hypothetical protein
MKKTTSRRLFLRNSTFAITGLTVLTPTLSNAMISSDCPYLGYNPYAESKSDLRTGVFNLNSIAVKGTIYKKDGLTPIKNATVEVWHLSPNSSKYRHRAKIIADGEGNYEFITDFPNKEEGKCSRIYFKVSNKGTASFTELVLNTSGPHITAEHWEKNRLLGDKLFPKKEESLNQSIIQFNISI